MSCLRTELVGLIWLIIVAFHVTANGQEDYINTVIHSLDKANMLRNALERGNRGDGIHYGWMDDMKEFRVRQISFTLGFEWTDNKVGCVSLKQIDYHPEYYRYSQVVQEASVLEKIHGSEFEKSVKREAIKRGKEMLLKVLNGKPNATGTVYINLLDDERLPILYDMPEVSFSVVPN